VVALIGENIERIIDQFLGFARRRTEQIVVIEEAFGSGHG
jgi:hypothetical protein